MFLGKKTRVFREEKNKKTCVFKKTTKNLNGKSETRNEPKIAEIREYENLTNTKTLKNDPNLKIYHHLKINKNFINVQKFQDLLKVRKRPKPHKNKITKSTKSPKPTKRAKNI